MEAVTRVEHFMTLIAVILSSGDLFNAIGAGWQSLDRERPSPMCLYDYPYVPLLIIKAGGSKLSLLVVAPIKE